MNRLKDKVALVTGAARGIGAAISRVFAVEGALVIVSDLNEAGARQTAESFGAAWIGLDVRLEADWLKAMDWILATHGRLDVLVNNAGITGLEDGSPHDPENASLDSWQAVHRTNLDGVFLGCKHALRTMRARPPGAAGAIVNISSRSGLVGIPAAAAYASSKAAVRNHTKSVALYCAEQKLPECVHHRIGDSCGWRPPGGRCCNAKPLLSTCRGSGFLIDRTKRRAFK